LRFGDFAVLHSGNIGRKRRLDILLRAAQALTPHAHVRIIVAGNGPARNGPAKEQLMALCSARQYEFPARPAQRAPVRLSWNADLHVLSQEASVADLVLPSKPSGMLASGKPMLVMAELGTEMTSFLCDSAIVVPPGDSDALAAAILSAPRNRSPDASQVVHRRNLAKLLSKTAAISSFARVITG